MPPVLLASGSVYRRRLLERLQLPFSIEVPEVDETPLAGESPEDTVMRLSHAKASAVASRDRGAIVIASDQLGVLDGRPLHKPGTLEGACAQLRAASGQQVQFLTGLVVLQEASGRRLAALERCTVEFRELDARQIASYVERERPIDCAGSFKVEGLGIALFRRVSSDDPTVLEGLPLIRLTGFLAEFGVRLPVHPGTAGGLQQLGQ